MYVKFSEKAHCCEIRDIVKHHHGTNKEAKTSHHNTYQYDPLFRSKFAKLMENKCLAMFVQIKKNSPKPCTSVSIAIATAARCNQTILTKQLDTNGLAFVKFRTKQKLVCCSSIFLLLLIHSLSLYPFLSLSLLSLCALALSFTINAHEEHMSHHRNKCILCECIRIVLRLA